MYKPNNNAQRGQSLMEMAITLPVLILILSGLLDLGRVYYTAIALEEAVAEAALYLAIDPDCADSTDPDGPIPVDINKCADPNNALYRAEHAGGNNEFSTDPTQIKWNIPWPQPSGMAHPYPTCQLPDKTPTPGVGCKVMIQVEYKYDFLTPGIESIANGATNGNGLTLTFQATQIIVFE